MDVAEAYAWGQKFLLGYGKHPPLSGWVAGLWFTMFPAADWATYALAMATVGVGMVICWLVALRVVDARRAFLVVVMMWIRWSLPRLRIDQVMMTCLQYFLPISCVLLMGVCLLVTRDVTRAGVRVCS